VVVKRDYIIAALNAASTGTASSRLLQTRRVETVFGRTGAMGYTVRFVIKEPS